MRAQDNRPSLRCLAVTTALATAPRAACPLCGGRRRERLFEKDGWPVVRCAACGLLYVDAHLDRDALDAIYGSGYYRGEVFRDYLGERRIRLQSGRGRVEQIARLMPSGRLLDVGCAAGS